VEYAQTAYRLTFTREVAVSRAVKHTLPTIPPAGFAPVAEAAMKAEQACQGIFVDEPKPYTIKAGTVLYSLEQPVDDPEVVVEASEGDFWGDLYTYIRVPRDSFRVEKVPVTR